MRFLFKIALNKIYLTQGDTARISIGIVDDLYRLQDDDLVYFIVTRGKEVIELDELGYSPYVAFFKRGKNITIYPEDTEDLEDGTYYYHVRVKIGGVGDLNTILGPEAFILEPREGVY